MKAVLRWETLKRSSALGLAVLRWEGCATGLYGGIARHRKAAGQYVQTPGGNLGVAYHNGLGVAKDDVESVRWYRKAAD